MADPFGALSSGFGSFVNFINNSRDNAELYRRYGPNYRNVLQDRSQRNEMQALTDLEDLRRSRASATSAELGLDVDRYNATQARFDASRLLGTNASGAPIAQDDKKFTSARVGTRSEDNLRGIGPGAPELTPMTEIRGAEAFKRDEEEKMIGNVREGDKFRAEMDLAEARVATEKGRRQAALAAAGSSNALAGQRDARTEEIREADETGFRDVGGTGGGAKSGQLPKLSEKDRESLALSFANEFLADSGEKSTVKDSNGGDIEIDGISSRYLTMKEVPTSLQKKALAARDEYMLSRQQPKGQEGDESFTVKTQREGGGSSGRVFKSREDPAAQELERGIASKLDSEGRLKEGEEMTPEEIAYLQALRERGLR